MKLKQVFAFFIITLLFLGSVGVPIYKHTCLHAHQTIRTFFIPSNHCEIESKAASISDECCEVPATDTELDDQCCVEDVTYFQFHGFHSKVHSEVYSPVFISTQHLELMDTSIPLCSIDQQNIVSITDPPPLAPRKRLIKNCIWRI